MSSAKVWYSYMGGPYKGDCPPFYELDGKPWYDELNRNIPAIREKTLALLEEKMGDLKTYFNTGIVEGGKWEARGFVSWGKADKLLESEKGRAVYEYFKHIPGLVLLSVSVLRSHTHVKAHNGDTDATYRLHIPIYIPAGLPECGLRVGGIDKPWTNDKVTAFSDANLHEAWNQSEQTRIVLIADVVREDVKASPRTVCINVMSLLMMQKLYGMVHKVIPKALVPAMRSLTIAALKPSFNVWFAVKGFTSGKAR